MPILLHLGLAACIVISVVYWAAKSGLEVLKLTEAIRRYAKRRRKRRQKKQRKGAAP
jgi:uncharacterized OsmC-like protein